MDPSYCIDYGAVRGKSSLTTLNVVPSVSSTAGTLQESHLKDSVSGSYTIAFSATITADRTITLPDSDLDLSIGVVGGSAQLTTAGKIVVSDGDGTISESQHLSEDTDAVTNAGGEVGYAVRKTAAYTMTNADRSIVGDTDSTDFQVDLPASPVQGQQARVANAGTGILTVDGNGNNVRGQSSGTLLNGDVLYVEYDTTEGWW